MTTAPSSPRRLRRVAFGYTLDYFPGPLIVGHHQLKRKLERAGFAVAVTLAPLNDLSPEVDILFVPVELAEAARQAAPHCRIEVLDTLLNHPSYNALIRQLAEGHEWTAARLSERPHQEEMEGQIVRYRGYERIE